LRYAYLLILPLLAAGVSATASAQVPGAPAVQAQWFTGSLEAPSPALPKAGMLAIEPYVIYQVNTGAYGSSGGHQSVAHDISQINSVTMFKIGITDRLSLEVLPSFAHVWNDQTSVTGMGDLPVEFEYRFNNENNETGFPSVTASVGVSFPIGDYEHLQAPLDGLGSGAYTLKQELLLQSLFDTPGQHPLRLRLYGGAFESVTNVPVHDMSVYGTEEGFVGHAAPGVAAVVGLGAGYGLDRRWVLAFDVVQNFARGTRIRGIDALGNSVNSRGAGTAGTALAPAVEYNFSSHVGIIAGVEFSATGRNTSSYIAPQIALAASF
jgi:hypothetical protein